MRRTLLAAAMLLLSGCYEWTTIPGPPRSAITALAPDDGVRVWLKDGSLVQIARPRLAGDTLVVIELGRARDGEVRRIPVDSVASVSDRHLNGPATATAVLASLGGIVAVMTIGVMIAFGGLHGID